jgi:hypothetical protein
LELLVSAAAMEVTVAVIPFKDMAVSANKCTKKSRPLLVGFLYADLLAYSFIMK